MTIPSIGGLTRLAWSHQRLLLLGEPLRLLEGRAQPEEGQRVGEIPELKFERHPPPPPCALVVEREAEHVAQRAIPSLAPAPLCREKAGEPQRHRHTVIHVAVQE